MHEIVKMCYVLKIQWLQRHYCKRCYLFPVFLTNSRACQMLFSVHQSVSFPCQCYGVITSFYHGTHTDWSHGAFIGFKAATLETEMPEGLSSLSHTHLRTHTLSIDVLNFILNKLYV